MQQAAYRQRLPGPHRRPPEPGHPRRVRVLHRHAPLRHGRRARRTRRRGARPGGRPATDAGTRRAVPAGRRRAGPGNHAVARRPDHRRRAAPARLRAPLRLPEGARPRLVRVRRDLGCRSARRGGRAGPRRATGPGRCRPGAVAGPPRRAGNAGPAGHRGDLPRRRGRRARRSRAAAPQCVQGSAGQQRRDRRSHAARRGCPASRSQRSAREGANEMSATLDTPQPAGMTRIDGPDKVTGRARYAFEHPVEGAAYAWPVQSTIAKGEIRSFDTSAALALPGVLAALTPDNAPRLTADDPELALFQSRAVAYRGQLVAAVVGTTLETARAAADLVRIDYAEAPHDVTLTPDHRGLYKPDKVNPNFPTDTESGDPDGAFAAAPVRVDKTYRTPGEHNNPMEPHATIAWWDGDRLTVFDSTQGPSRAATIIAGGFGLQPDQE